MADPKRLDYTCQSCGHSSTSHDHGIGRCFACSESACCPQYQQHPEAKANDERIRLLYQYEMARGMGTTAPEEPSDGT